MTRIASEFFAKGQPMGDLIEEMALKLQMLRDGCLLVAVADDAMTGREAAAHLAARLFGRVALSEFTFHPESLSLAAHLRRLLPPTGPSAVSVHGLSKLPTGDRAQAIRHLNVEREALRDTGYSVVLWIRSSLIPELTFKAPDLWAWRAGIYTFDQPLSQMGVEASPLSGLGLGEADRLRRLAGLYEEQLVGTQDNPRLEAELRLNLSQVYQQLGRSEAEVRALREQARRLLSDEEYLRQLRRAYLDYLVGRHEWLDFSGIPQVRNVVRLRLDDVFVPLSAMRELDRSPDERERRQRRLDHLAVREREAEYALEAQPIKEMAQREVSLAEALEERRLVILGDPGSGKTTLLKHVALTLAREDGAERLGLEDDWLPVLFPISAYARALREEPDLALTSYLPRFFAARELPDLAPLLATELQAGRCLVLLDGLDEVQDATERLRVVHRVQDMVRGYGDNRYVVTSRIAGYEAARLADFAHVTVMPFGEEEIEGFAGRWCLAYETTPEPTPGAEERAARDARQLVASIMANPSIRRLATNPLLLTILALIHYQNVKLPERRVELYRLCVEALAETWNRARSLSEEPIDLHLGQRRLDARFVVNTLGPVALWLHETQPGGLMEEPALVEYLAEVLAEQEGLAPPRARDLAHNFLDLIRQGSGLLQERGLGLWSFMHLTFEEYLAARAIADLVPDPAAYVRPHLYDSGWREVILLAVAASPRREATRLVESILGAPAAGEDRGKNVVLAGECLVDVGRDSIEGRLWNRVMDVLVALLEEPDERKLAPLPTRVAAGDVLGQLDDPRIAEEQWVVVPAGEFLMGSEESDSEKPSRRVYVDAFRMGKYPVTNAQYRRFIEAGGYQTERYWSPEGWAWLHRTAEEEVDLPEWRKRGGRTQPEFWDHPELGTARPNRPVVGVTWYEAEAYCRWLTEVLRAEGTIRPEEVIRLPTEAEWEKAARGTDGRRWPWGDEWDADRANTWESEVHTTTPVGIYPHGASPYGTLDMAGNVWEWTADWFGPYRHPHRPPEEGQYRVLRGGSWNLSQLDARCACRLRLGPDGRNNYIGFRVAASPGSPWPLDSES